MKFHWGSSLLHFSPLSLLTYSSLHLILSLLLHWGKRKICHLLPLTATWWMSQWRGLFFNCGQEDFPVATLTLPSFLTRRRKREKMGTEEESCPQHETSEQLMMLPEVVLEVWRDVIHSQSYRFLPPSLSFPLFLHLAAFRACSKCFWDPGHLISLLSPFVRESLFVQTRWGLTKIEGRHFHCLTELRRFLKVPKSHGKG